MPTPAALPPAIAHRPFSVAEARALGVPRGRLRSGDLRSPFYGVRASGTDDNSLRALALACSQRMTAGQYFSHLTAAQLHGMRLPEGHRWSTLHVTSPMPQRAPRLAGVTGHQADPGIVPTPKDGLRLSSPLDTWCQLGSVLGLDDLVIMGDGLIRRRRPPATLQEVLAAVEAYRGRRGARTLREAAALMRGGTDSARETMLRLVVVRAGLPEPEVNARIYNRFGARIAHADLAFREYRTILEYDGGQHRDDEEQFHQDIDRLDELMEERWRVIRVNKSLMARRPTLIRKIRVALEAGGWRG